MQRRRGSLLPELAEGWAGFPSWPGWRALFDDRLLRVEDGMEDGRYVVRAEIPGIDPAKDVDITVRDGLLTITAERGEKKESTGRSEFSYGSFERTVPLPSGADENDVKASYDNGILTVSVAVPKTAPAEKHIPVQAAKKTT